MAMATGSSSNVVLEKVNCVKVYADLSIKEQRKLAHELTDRKLLFNRFEHLLLAVEEEIQAAYREYEPSFTHSVELEDAHQRAKHGMARVCHLPVKLFLSRLPQRYALGPAATFAGKLSKVLWEFGALHAGLMVGNIRVEWGTDSLIDPQWEDPQFVEEDFVAHVHQQGEWALAASSFYRKFSLADREQRIEDKVKLITNSAEEKRRLIMNLVEVIIRYNCTKKYNAMSCNSQHFVTDAMHALGIKSIPRFSGPLNDYLQQLKCGRIDIPDEFADHTSLDAYVKTRLEANVLSLHDMEYLLLHYYRLHLNSLPKDGDIDEWECEVHSCQCEFLAEKVDYQAMMYLYLGQDTPNSGRLNVQHRPTAAVYDQGIKQMSASSSVQHTTTEIQEKAVCSSMQRPTAEIQEVEEKSKGYFVRIREYVKEHTVGRNKSTGKQDAEEGKEGAKSYIEILEEQLSKANTEIEEIKRRMEGRVAQIEKEKEEALAHITWERDDIQQQLQVTEFRVTQLEREVEEANQRTTAAELQLSHQLQRVIQLEVEVGETNRRVNDANLHVNELSRQLQLEQQRTHAIQEHAEMVTRRAEAQLQQSQSYWMISRDEIEFMETELGTGAYGTVKVAMFRGSQVAAKCYHQILLSDHNLGLFRREITIASHLRHPNLVQFIGALVERELILLTELMNTSLDALMHHGQLHERTVTSISIDVAQALNYLHLMRPQPIVHRDICRGNVLLDPLPDNKWRAKVSDYGSVNLLEHLTTRHPGNPFYEAPEAKDPDLQSPKMDIYSFGVLLAEMLTNELPEKEHRRQQVLKIEIYHPNFIGLVRQCLSEEKDCRLSAQDIIADLKGR